VAAGSFIGEWAGGGRPKKGEEEGERIEERREEGSRT
jgi:hypothetical protein